MFSSKSDRIVPVRDRRQHIRILTLKNFWRALLVVTVVFGSADLALHLRHSSSDDYGRIVQREIAHPQVVASRAPAVVKEAPIEDAQSADPFLVEPAVREQYLTASSNVQPQTVNPIDINAKGVTAEAAATARRSEQGTNLAIVGDATGVSVQATAKRDLPKLSGGIFR